MKLFRIKRKSDGCFVSGIRGRKLSHNKLGKFFTTELQAVSHIFASDRYAKDYSIEIYSLHKQGEHELNSTWHTIN